MKKVFLILLILVLSFCAIAQKQDTVVTITGRVASGKPMHLLVERQVGMTQRLDRKSTRLNSSHPSSSRMPSSA